MTRVLEDDALGLLQLEGVDLGQQALTANQRVGGNVDLAVPRELARTQAIYVGARLSQAAGLLGWNELTAAISHFRQSHEGDTGDNPPQDDEALQNATYLRQFIGEKDSTNRPILSHDSESIRTFGRTVLINLLLRLPKVNPDASFDTPRGSLRSLVERDLEFHSAVWRTQCQGVFTTNYDMLIEDAYRLARPWERIDLYCHTEGLRTYRFNAQFLRFLLGVPRFVLKLHGDIDDIGSMLFDPETAWDDDNPLGGQAGSDLCHAFSAALHAGHMIYIGCGGRDRTFRQLHTWRDRASHGPYQRLFFVSATEVPNIVEDMGSAIDDLVFPTYGSVDDQHHSSLASTELRAFLNELIYCTESRPQFYSREAVDLCQQLTSGGPSERHWVTTAWDVGGIQIRRSWNRGSPQRIGRYLWRRLEQNPRLFFATIQEESGWWGDYLFVWLDGKEISWRYARPCIDNGKPPDEEFALYELIGPLDEDEWGTLSSV